jgi:hypothetical protein
MVAATLQPPNESSPTLIRTQRFFIPSPRCSRGNWIFCPAKTTAPRPSPGPALFHFCVPFILRNDAQGDERLWTVTRNFTPFHETTSTSEEATPCLRSAKPSPCAPQADCSPGAPSRASEIEVSIEVLHVTWIKSNHSSENPGTL